MRKEVCFDGKRRRSRSSVQVFLDMTSNGVTLRDVPRLSVRLSG